MKFLIPKDFKIKHKILSIFNDELKTATLHHAMEVMIDVRDLHKKIPELTEKELVNQLNALLSQKEVENLDIKYHSLFTSTSEGIASFIDSKYLELGKRQTLDRWYDYGKNVAVWIAAIGLFLSLLKECNTSKSSEELAILLAKQETRLRNLENANTLLLKNENMNHTLKQDSSKLLPTETKTIQSLLQTKKE